MSMNTFKQGLFTPKRPERYKGDVTNIRFMSSWELHFFKFLDNNPNVLEWSSEELAIPYYNPLDKKMHKYFPDCIVKYRNKYGKIKTEMIEIKPMKQTYIKERASTTERVRYATNMYKWRAAKKFCDLKGIEFRIVTERELFKK